MRNPLNILRGLQRKFHFRLWLDRLDLHGDDMNESDRNLRDARLMHRDRPHPTDPNFFL